MATEAVLNEVALWMQEHGFADVAAAPCTPSLTGTLAQAAVMLGAVLAGKHSLLLRGFFVIRELDMIRSC